MQVQPYLNFNGHSDEAIEFYKKAVGAKVTRLVRFRDFPEPKPPEMKPEFADKVMHASLLVGDTDILLSDGRCQGASTFQGISLSLSVKTDADAKRYFAALSDGGKITMPMNKTFFSSNFGMLTDRFGVSWMIVVQT